MAQVYSNIRRRNAPHVPGGCRWNSLRVFTACCHTTSVRAPTWQARPYRAKNSCLTQPCEMSDISSQSHNKVQCHYHHNTDRVMPCGARGSPTPELFSAVCVKGRFQTEVGLAASFSRRETNRRETSCPRAFQIKGSESRGWTALGTNSRGRYSGVWVDLIVLFEGDLSFDTVAGCYRSSEL